MSPCAIHSRRKAVVGRHMAVGHGEVVPPFDWIALHRRMRSQLPVGRKCQGHKAVPRLDYTEI